MDARAHTHTHTICFCMVYIYAQMILISLHVTMSPSMTSQHISINISEFCNNLIAFFCTVDI